jgi:hypothetical protein
MLVTEVGECSEQHCVRNKSDKIVGIPILLARALQAWKLSRPNNRAKSIDCLEKELEKDGLHGFRDLAGKNLECVRFQGLEYVGEHTMGSSRGTGTPLSPLGSGSCTEL